MRRPLVALLALASLPVFAQVTSTRETKADWYCCDDQACKVNTPFQRQDTAISECINRSLGDGKDRWVMAGRYRVTAKLPSTAPTPAPSPTPTPTPTPAPTPTPTPTPASSATLGWTPPTTNMDGSALTDLAGYRIYYGTSPASLTKIVQVPQPDAKGAVVDGLTSGTWYFAVEAYTAAGAESALSAAVSKTL